MITSKIQYKASLKAVETLKKTLNAKPSDNWSEGLAKATMKKTQRKINEIEENIKEYEHYTSSEVTHIYLDTLDDLMKAPIRIRLVLGESVKEFADELDINKRQILRYEEEQYENCTMATFKKIMTKVDVLISNKFNHKTA
ncbi:MAG: hypothetical protein HRT37_26640 [Alteromonadaceae bacterium]|nr:hypothetical protein [Alteromonadaceae bacterium]